uniref:Ig-like domain-containing protein n=1 Tax=Salarias fasciatus TaxID=181472 RepID=A0A672IN79_SALFA
MKSVAAQQNVTLTCPRKSGHKENLFWIRIISGHQPEFLGGTYGFDYEGVHQTPHFTTKQEPGTFILNIHQSQISDTGLYYCIQTETLQMSFVRRVFLMVKGPQSSISGIIQAPPSAAVHPGESVSLQCSVLSDSEKKACVLYCAVAACGEVMFGNGAKLDIKYRNTRTLSNTEIALCIVCVALAISVTVSVYLIWTRKKQDGSGGETRFLYNYVLTPSAAVN